MENDVAETENDLNFDERLAGKEFTTMADSAALGSLSDVEIDYETRSEVSEDDERNAEDTEKCALNTSVKVGSVSLDEICSEKLKSSKEARPTKTNEKRRLTRETKDEESRSSKVPKTEKTSKPNSSKSTHSEIKESTLATLSQNAKFFLMKTSDKNNLKVSQERQVWFTDPQNVTVLNAAVDAVKNVILIFSAKWTGKFGGFAILKGRSTSDDPPRDWSPSVKTLGGLFHVNWLSRKELLFVSSNHLRNPCSGGKLVSICVDGQEIDQKIGLELCQLVLSKGIESKETPSLQKNEPPVELKHESKIEIHSSTSKKSKETGNHLSDSPHKDSPKLEENYSRSGRRGRSPVSSKRRIRNRSSKDRIERTQEKDLSRKMSRRGSTIPIDLRYKTSRGQNLRKGAYDGKGKTDNLSPLNNMDCSHDVSNHLLSGSGRSDDFEYLSDDELDVSGAQPSRMSGRFVIERSPVSQMDESPSPAVKSEFSPDNYELMSENESESRVELSNKGVAAPERYCTIVVDEPLERSPSRERVLEVQREVYETRESFGRSHSRSPATQNDDHYQLDGSDGKSLSHRQNKTNYLSGNARDIYSSNESISRYHSHRRSPSSSRSIRTVYSSHEAKRRRSSSRDRSRKRSPTVVMLPRRSPSIVRSHSAHPESRRATRRTSYSRDRSESTLKEYTTHESSRVRSQYYDRSLDTNMDYQQELNERSSSSRIRRSPDVISRELTPSQKIIDYERYESHRIRSKESSRGSRDYDLYDKRSSRVVSGSENRSSVPEDFPDTSSMHYMSSRSRGIRESSEHREDRINVYHRDERFVNDGKSRIMLEREPSVYTMGRVPERVPGVMHSHREQRDRETPQDYFSSSASFRPKDYDTLRSESPPERTNHYYGYGRQTPLTVPDGLHTPTPAPSSHLPASHVNYFQGNPPPLLPRVSSTFFEPVTLPSPSKYNPNGPTQMIPPAPSQYVESVPGVPPVPPRFQQEGFIPPPPSRGSWSPRTSHHHQTPSQSISAEEFIERCQNNKPIRPSTTSGSRRWP